LAAAAAAQAPTHQQALHATVPPAPATDPAQAAAAAHVAAQADTHQALQATMTPAPATDPAQAAAAFHAAAQAAAFNQAQQQVNILIFILNPCCLLSFVDEEASWISTINFTTNTH
jgi:hypothetical protein